MKESRHTHIHDSCRTYAWGMSDVWMSHGTSFIATQSSVRCKIHPGNKTTHTHAHAHPHTRTHTHKHTRTHTHTHIRTHTHTCTRKHTRTHAHIHTPEAQERHEKQGDAVNTALAALVAVEFPSMITWVHVYIHIFNKTLNINWKYVYIHVFDIHKNIDWIYM